MTAAEIADRLAGRAADVCAHLLPAGRRRGDEYEVADITGAAGRSLKVNLNGKAGTWKDFATGDGGDLLDLWRQVRGLSSSDAMRDAAEWLGYKAHGEHNATHDGDAIPADAPNGHPKWKTKPAGRWCYTGADGKPRLIVYRYNTRDGGKVFFTFDYVAQKWCKNGEHALPELRPLLGLHRFAHRPAGEITLTEGEACAEALNRIGVLATTTLGGAGQVHKADFGPLAGWVVRIWRDADDAGQKYADIAAARLRAAGAEPHMVPVPDGSPEGWDAADAINCGWTLEEIRGLLDMAEPIEGAAEETDTPTGRFKFITDVELENMELPEQLIEGLIFAGSHVMLVGDPGSLKSFLALDWAYRIVRGKDWAGRAVKQGSVLYVLAEGKGQFKLRTLAWKQVNDD